MNLEHVTISKQSFLIEGSSETVNTFQLSCFIAVAEYLNFARAAEQLHVTHPAVSQQIKSLEKELNTKLFIRTTRTVKLTEEGKTFLNDAQQMVAISDRAKKRFENAHDRQIQTLSLGCYSYPCLFLLSDTLRELATEYPSLHPRLQVIPFQHIYRLLEEGDLDAVIGFKESDSAKIPANYKEIAKVPFVCICSKENPLSKRKSLTLDEIKTERLVLLLPTKASLQIAHIQSQLMGGRAPSEFYFCESGEAVTVLVQAGFGISILPDLFIPRTFPASIIPVQGIEPVSFGIYYKSLQGNAPLKDIIRIMKKSGVGLL